MLSEKLTLNHFFQSEKCDKPTGNLTLKFWKQSGPIENVASRISVMSLREFRGEPGEVGFLEFFFQSAQVLRSATIVMANPRFAPFSKDAAFSKVSKSCRNMASKSCKMLVHGSNNGPAGGEVWNFQTGSDFFLPGPFRGGRGSQPILVSAERWIVFFWCANYETWYQLLPVPSRGSVNFVAWFLVGVKR